MEGVYVLGATLFSHTVSFTKGHRHLIKGYKVDVKKAMSRKDITSMGGPKALKAANFFSGRGNRRSYGGGFDR